MAAQPAGKAVGAACDLAVQTYSADAAEIVRISGFWFLVSGICEGHGFRRAGRATFLGLRPLKRRDHTQINHAYIVLA